VSRANPRDHLPARGTATRHPDDPKFRRIKAYVLAQYRGANGRTPCFICGHGDGPGETPADGIDHLVPVSECEARGISPWASGNMRPAHTKVPCRVCAEAAAALGNTEPGNRAGYCNALRGNSSIDAARLKIARRTGLVIMGVSAEDRPGAARHSAGERSWD
jgi:hypothetical protein